MSDVSAAINSLLTALAVGARAASGIASDAPLPPPPSSSSSSSSSLAVGDFTFLSSFPEFQNLTASARSRVASILRSTLSSLSVVDGVSVVLPPNSFSLPNDASSVEWGADTDDPELWESCADACEVLLDRVCDVLDGGGLRQLGGREALVGASSLARQTASDKTRRMASLMNADMDKPQKTYSFASQIDNGRLTPFVPRVSSLKPHGITPLYLVPVSGHGLDNALYTGHAAPTSDEELVAPKLHYPHPYVHEINALVHQPGQMERPDDAPSKHGLNGTLHPASGKKPSVLDVKTGQLTLEGCVFIDNDQDLAVLSERLGKSDVKEIAVDLEAHSFRSFSGFTCLMQISVRTDVTAQTTHAAAAAAAASASNQPSSAHSKSVSRINSSCDFLIDTLALRRSLPQLLSPVFADPSIVKVMHGADGDVLWLQRDFGIYVVNLFDTGRAARHLNLPSFSLKHLERRYADFEPDKTHQLADWRVRPLPVAMMSYARSDTHFLLDIYDELRRDLHAVGGEAAVAAVLEDSRQVCLRRFEREPFRVNGWKSLLRPSDDLNDKQTYCLAKLWDWRDATARDQDESLGYVCPGGSLLRLATIMPTKVDGLHRAINPLPQLVLLHAETILGIVEEASKAGARRPLPQPAAAPTATATLALPPTLKVGDGSVSQLRANASSFSFKPPTVPQAANRPSGMSPVLGTEALYRQAGWLTPTPPAFRSSPPSAAAYPYSAASRVGVVRPVAEDDDDDYIDDEDIDAGSHKARGFAVVPAVKVVPAADNRGYVTSKYNKDSVELGGGVGGSGFEIDGLGAETRAAFETSSGAAARLFLHSGDGKRQYLLDPAAPSRSVVAQRAADAIKSDLYKKGAVLSLADGSAFGPPSALAVSAAAASEPGFPPASSPSPPPNAAIPKSMSEIYQISNRNRRRNKEKKKNEEADGDADGDSVGETDHQDLNASNSSSAYRHRDLLNDSTASSVDESGDLDVDNVEKAEELLSRSGGTGGYFASRSKRQKPSEHSAEAMNAAAGGAVGGAASAAKRGNDSEVVKLITDIGWVESEREATELHKMMNETTSGGGGAAVEDETQQSLDGSFSSRSTLSADSTLDSSLASSASGRSARRNKKNGKASKQQQQQQHTQMQMQQLVPVPAFDYASANVVGAYGAGGLSSNPFFANAANEPRQQQKQHQHQQHQHQQHMMQQPGRALPGQPGMQGHNPNNHNPNNLIVEKMPKSGDRTVTINRR